MRNHMWMHTVPMFSSMVLLSNWGFFIGTPLSPMHALSGFVGAATLFASWLFKPLDTGELWERKIAAVYNTKDTYAFLTAGATFGVVALLMTYRASQNQSAR